MSRLLPYVAFSVVCHGALSLFLQHVERPERLALRQQPIEFVALEPPKVEPPRPEPRVEEPEPEHAFAAEPAPRPQPRTPRAASPPAERLVDQALATGPVRLAGVKFSNAGTFDLPGGGRVGPTVAARTTAVPAIPGRPSNRVVSLADLSKRPAPPKLDARLQASYPPVQRRMGVEGEALLELLLSERGEVVDAKIRSQTSPPFGAACRETLLGTRWSPPLDGTGQAVRTRLSYRCSFRVTP